jgi:hypothetical protein
MVGAGGSQCARDSRDLFVLTRSDQPQSIRGFPHV